MYCENCGEILKEGINFCPNCGMKIVSKDVDRKLGISNKKINKKIPILAAFLSFIIPGAGQMYNQEIRKGIIYLTISIFIPIMALYLLYENKNLIIAIFANLILIAYLIFYIYVIIDAYKTATI